MRPDDKNRFFELLDLTYDIIGVGEGKFISGPAKAMFFDDLAQYPIDMIEKSLTAHRRDPQRGKFTPKPADIIHQIERRMPVQWVTADEAFARIPLTEDTPALLNQVTAQALAVAMPFLAQPRPDMNAARMAFRGCYDRLAEAEKLARRAPVHFLSPAGTMEAQADVLAEGVRLGLLPPSAAPDVALLAAPTPAGQAQLKQIRAMLALPAMPKPEGVSDE